MTKWVGISELSMVLETEDSKGVIDADGRSCMAVYVYFRAKDAESRDIKLAPWQLKDKIKLINYQDKTPLDWVGETWNGNDPQLAKAWCYCGRPSGSSYSSDQNTSKALESLKAIIPGLPTPIPDPPPLKQPHPTTDWQFVKFYVSCGYEVRNRIMPIGVHIQTEGSDIWSWYGDSHGNHEYIQLYATGRKPSKAFQAGTYYIVPTSAVNSCIHPYGGDNIENDDPIDLHNKFEESSKWNFVLHGKGLDGIPHFIIQNHHIPQFHIYRYSRDLLNHDMINLMCLGVIISEYEKNGQISRFKYFMEPISHHEKHGESYRIWTDVGSHRLAVFSNEKEKGQGICDAHASVPVGHELTKNITLLCDTWYITEKSL